MTLRSPVFIPVIAPNGANQPLNHDSLGTTGRLVEVYADSYQFGDDLADLPAQEAAKKQELSAYDRKAIDKCWDRVAAPLRKNSPVLYQSGSVAANALRKMRFKTRFCAFFQWLRPNAAVESKRLHAVNAWGPTEGRSAELGLALALASAACAKRNRVIIATGALSATGDDPWATSVYRTNDIKVHPVGSIALKLNLISFQIQQGAFHELSQKNPLMVLTPKCFIQAGQTYEVQRLTEVKTLENQGVKVVTVEWLSEALSAIQADRTQYLAKDRMLQLLAGLMLSTATLLSIWLLWLHADIPMRFVSVYPNKMAAEPFELCAGKQNQYPIGLTRTLLSPEAPVGSLLAWRTRIGNPESLDAKLYQNFGFGGFYVAVIVASEYSNITVDYAKKDNTDAPLRITPGTFYEGWMQLNETAETNVLILLAQRYPAFDAKDLRDQFQQYVQTSGAAAEPGQRLDVDAATDFIKSLAEGSLIFPFMTVQEGSKCF